MTRQLPTQNRYWRGEAAKAKVSAAAQGVEDDFDCEGREVDLLAWGVSVEKS